MKTKIKRILDGRFKNKKLIGSQIHQLLKQSSSYKIARLFCILMTIYCLPLFSQLQGSQWTFGDSAYIDFSIPQNPLILESGFDTRGSCSSVADSAGNLLFYCGNISGNYLNDCNFLYKYNQIYNKNHQIMENGNCLTGFAWWNENTIVPIPKNDSLYYVFAMDSFLEPGFTYAIVNINANDGLGAVIESNHYLLSFENVAEDDHLIGCVKSISHANGRDWWVITKAGGPGVQDYGDPNLYYYFLITPYGITQYTRPSEDNPEFSLPGCDVGFNKDGNQMYYRCTNLGIYDYDRCSGELSNYQIIDSGGIELDKFYWSAEFSPNGRFLYAIQTPSYFEYDNIFYLLQYDLQDENPALTKDTLRVFGPAFMDTINYSFESLGMLRLAPDNKIYITQFYEDGNYNWPWPDSVRNEINMNLSVINYPDSGYPACQFEPFSFGLGGKRTYGGLPNNPNYNLGVIDGSPCDTLGITGLKKGQSYLKDQFNIFPNPCHNFSVLEYKPAKQKGNIVITDAQGKIVFKEENIPVTLLQHGYELNLSAFKNGVYTVVLTSGDVKVGSSFVRM